MSNMRCVKGYNYQMPEYDCVMNITFMLKYKLCNWCLCVVPNMSCVMGTTVSFSDMSRVIGATILCHNMSCVIDRNCLMSSMSCVMGATVYCQNMNCVWGKTALCLITKTYLYNFDPLKPYIYIEKLGFTEVYSIFLISAQKHRLWVLVRNTSPRRF